jgi:cation:H+ antiporter
MSSILVWIQLVVCLAIILVAGTRLSKYGDIIADKTGLGRIWIGVVLLATVTSLPELFTGISSVAIIGKPDLTLGDLFGSNLINLVTIAIIDVLYTRGPILHYMGTGLVLAATASSFLIGAVAASIFVSQNVSSIGILNYIGIYSPVIFLLYLSVQYMLMRFERRSRPDPIAADKPVAENHAEISLKRVIIFFVIAALVTASAGTWLGFIGDQITIATGLKATFVGSLFLAICTSSPEIVVSISALRLGALDMAVGNVIGSNLFNMGVVVFLDDLFFTKGPILSYVSTDHIFTALIAMLMSSVVIIGLIYRPRFWPRIWVGIDTVGLIVLYSGAITVLYFLGRF